MSNLAELASCLLFPATVKELQELIDSSHTKHKSDNDSSKEKDLVKEAEKLSSDVCLWNTCASPFNKEKLRLMQKCPTTGHSCNLTLSATDSPGQSRRDKEAAEMLPKISNEIERVSFSSERRLRMSQQSSTGCQRAENPSRPGTSCAEIPGQTSNVEEIVSRKYLTEEKVKKSSKEDLDEQKSDMSQQCPASSSSTKLVDSNCHSAISTQSGDNQISSIARGKKLSNKSDAKVKISSERKKTFRCSVCNKRVLYTTKLSRYILRYPHLKTLKCKKCLK